MAYPTHEKLLELGNKSKMFLGVMMLYILRLREMEKKAVALMSTLREAYDLN
jgi:hypothetical protein